jgi:hypothetical protein
LTKFTRKDVEPYLRSYLEICISVAFFRVPKFQKIFLDCIKQSGEENSTENAVVDEWRHIDWDLNEEGNIEEESKEGDDPSTGLFQLFDWEFQFFRHIPKLGTSPTYQKELEDALRYIRHIEANKKW